MHRKLLAFALLVTLSGCHGWQHRASTLAREGRLESAVLHGGDFELRAWSRTARDETLFVFIDGDGLPWIDRGTRPATDPTAPRLLGLQLAAATPGAVLYLGRPCYFDLVSSPQCISALWTSDRYSGRIVDSMSAAIDRHARLNGFSQVVLIGYSGGGALGVLIAPRLERARAVLTLSANLDTEAWTKLHGFLPLEGSLNPAKLPPLPPRIAEWHVIGGRDSNVPREINEAYWSRIPASQLWVYPDADHICCWADLWPSIFARLRLALHARPDAPAIPVTRSRP